jgi:prevent-host-death family protein
VIWQVQTAKQRLSELIERAVTEGPQTITKHGRETVVVVEVGEYRRLTGAESGGVTFKEFLLTGPDFSALDLERAKDMPREVEF